LSGTRQMSELRAFSRLASYEGNNPSPPVAREKLETRG
jgi:hypothetical protein